MVHCSLPQHQQKGMMGQVIVGTTALDGQQESEESNSTPQNVSQTDKQANTIPSEIVLFALLGAILILFSVVTAWKRED